MNSSDTFGRRVGLGFFVVILVFVISVLTSLWKVTSNEKLHSHIGETRSPLVRASYLLLNSVNQSMVGIRGTLLFGGERLSADRAEAWTEIDRATADVVALAARENSNVDEQTTRELLLSIKSLREWQDEVEVLSKTSRPKAIALLNEKGAPMGRAVRDLVERIVAVQDGLLKEETAQAHANTQFMVYLEWLLLFVGVAIAGFTGLLITRNVVSPIDEAVKAAQRLSNEDFEGEVQLQGPYEIELLSRTFEKMRLSLKSLTEGLRDQNKTLEKQKWLTEGHAGLLDRMAGDQDIKTLAASILNFVCEKVEARLGAFYLLQGERLVPIQGFALGGTALYERSFGPREGLVGQAIGSDKVSVVTDLPADYFKVRSGLGEAPAAAVTLLPVAFDGKMTAMVELGSLQTPTHTKIEFLNGIGRMVGIAVNLSLSNQQTKSLLEETQTQAEELQAQQEELKVSNEELELKTKSLEASEEELRSQQDELRSTNEELEEQTLLLEREKEVLGLRTRELELTKSALESRAKEVEQVSRYKSEFLANMSHELRTPLNSILMLSQSLTENRGSNLNDRQLKALTTIHASGNDLLTLIEDILDLSKVEAGKLDVRPERVSVKDLCESMRQSFDLMAKDAGLNFDISIDKNVPPDFTSDPNRVKQILKNLLSNAFKFTNTGGITLRVTRPEGPTSSVRFVVKDTGIGIPEHQTKAVFDAFKQLDAKTTRKYGGTGLGLSIVRELVALLGGEIHLTSAENMGTEVTFTLPEVYSGTKRAEPEISDSPARPAPERAPLAAKTAQIDDDRGSLKQGDALVLIVEDDLGFADSLLDLCHDNGFKGIIVNDGVSAVKLAEEFVPQGILLDLSLPELDGSDVIRLLKDNPKTRHIPIQVITGHDRRQEVLSAGAMGFLKKPAQNNQLNDVLKKIKLIARSTSKKLLIVEDDPAQRRGIREFIEVPGVEIYEASNCKEALKLIEQEAFGCIVLDLNLPDMTGRDFLNEGKRLIGDAFPPVIIYTAQDLDDSELRSLERDAKSVIVKGAKSPERLFDEAMMFLHRLQKDLPDSKRKIVESLHDPTRILKGKSILVVDDDPRNILSLTHLLEDHGVRVSSCENGKEALGWLESNPVADLVLMDMMMPEMDGYEATRHLRRNPKFKGLPIVALTARAMKGERERCLEAGCDDYLSKPIENDKLISLLRVWLYRSK